jgi:hypothetical protein
MNRIKCYIFQNHLRHLTGLPVLHSTGPGQQLIVLDDTPGQCFPPYLGDGLLHSLLIRCVAPVHVSEQMSVLDHSPQAPSTLKFINVEYRPNNEILGINYVYCDN